MPPPWKPAAKPARSHSGLEAFGSHTSRSLDGGITYKPLTRGWVPFTRSGWVLFTLSKFRDSEFSSTPPLAAPRRQHARSRRNPLARSHRASPARYVLAADTRRAAGRRPRHGESSREPSPWLPQESGGVRVLQMHCKSIPLWVPDSTTNSSRSFQGRSRGARDKSISTVDRSRS